MSQFILFLVSLLQFYNFLMLAWVLMSWVPDLRFSKAYRFLDKIILPYIEPFRKIVPPINGIDISPILAFFAINIMIKLLYLLR